MALNTQDRGKCTSRGLVLSHHCHTWDASSNDMQPSPARSQFSLNQHKLPISSTLTVLSMGFGLWLCDVYLSLIESFALLITIAGDRQPLIAHD